MVVFIPTQSLRRDSEDNVYEYDQVNNILGLKNNAAVPSNNLMGGSSDYSYEYDDLYRLVKAEGKFNGTGANESHAYSLEMSYNTVGGITRKNQLHTNKGQEQKKTTYDMAYTYGDDQPHAPTHIGKQAYSYDANGNQTGSVHDVSGQRRDILWDEENRIRAISDNGANYHYIYDASGTRVIKGKSNGQSVYVNGEWKTGSGSMGNYTVYVNPYIVLKSGGYTKHYYIEGQRIVSKLGGGLDNKGKGPLKAGEGKVNYSTKHDELFEGIVRNLKWLAEDGSILTAGKSGKIPPGQVIGNSPGNGGTESFQYFYHPDHLGSTSYITDASGEVYQHLEYFAFGETFVEEHNNTDKTPYLFNGKELDEETGLYYYGARYYDAQTNVFLSVDPRSDNFPTLTPYQFAGNRGPNATDLDGLEPITPQGFVPTNLFVNPAPPPPPSGWHPPMSADYTKTTTKIEAKKATITTTTVLTGETSTKVVNRQYDVANGKNISSKIETKDPKGNSVNVSISFLDTSSDKQNSNNIISSSAVDGFVSTVKKANEMGAGIESLSVSATTNGNHKGGWYSGSSNHYKGSAIDIGLINGSRPTISDSLIQMAADSMSNINENFGPKFDHRKTKNTSDQRHTTWIHFSFLDQ
jgi:RHS repeat-associated protein